MLMRFSSFALEGSALPCPEMKGVLLIGVTLQAMAPHQTQMRTLDPCAHHVRQRARRTCHMLHVDPQVWTRTMLQESALHVCESSSTRREA